jgi:predicted phage gp36 major capsid-like protein
VGGNLFTFDKVRQFDTAGGSGVWQDRTGSASAAASAARPSAARARTPARPACRGSSAARRTSRRRWPRRRSPPASKILVIGDWRYFVIVDRVGMDIELLPHLLGANRRPTGQRGLYAYWRNSSDVLSAAAFQVLVTG